MAPTVTPSPSPTATETPVVLPTPSDTPTAEPIPPLLAVEGEIDAPLEGNVIAELYTVYGIATGSAFASYGLEVLVDASWLPMNAATPVVFTPALGELGQWDTASLANGAYLLRLTVNGVNGEVASASVQVTIAN